ncbi:Uncharacterised protein [Burkholderia pseudomallei]|nr:Uncharacterised protein [Burkholderia pseudomallei]VBP85026.1 Uncharacterised protein [Burkholderia pseudomallei]
MDARRTAARRLRVQHRSLRSRDGPAHGRSLPEPARGRRRASGRRAPRAAAPRRRRTRVPGARAEPGVAAAARRRLRARSVRPAGGAASGARGGELRRGGADLRRARPRVRSRRAQSARGRRARRGSRRAADRAQSRLPDRDARRAEGGRGIHADEPRRSRAQARPDRRTGRRALRRARRGERRARAGAHRARDAPRARRAVARARGGARVPAAHAGVARVRDLHVGLDRAAEGRDDRAARHAEPPAREDRRPGDRRGRRRRRDGGDHLRRVDLAIPRRVARGRPHGGDAGRRGVGSAATVRAARRRRRDRVRIGAVAHEDPDRRTRGAAGASPARPGTRVREQRRGADARAVRALVRVRAARSRGQHVRRDRVLGRYEPPVDPRAAVGRVAVRADPGHAAEPDDLPARRAPRAGANRRDGRGPHRRRRRRARLSGRSGAHRARVRAGPVLASAGPPPVQDGRPRALPAGRHPRIPRPRGFPGEDPRPAGRDRRSRKGDRRSRQRASGGGGRRARRQGPPVSARLRDPASPSGADRARAARVRGRPRRELHGARVVRADGPIPAERERQGRPQAPAEAGGSGHLPPQRACRARDANRSAARRAVARAARRRRDRRARQLLRARRPFAARGRADAAHAHAVRRRAAAAHAVPVAAAARRRGGAGHAAHLGGRGRARARRAPAGARALRARAVPGAGVVRVPDGPVEPRLQHQRRRPVLHRQAEPRRVHRRVARDSRAARRAAREVRLSRRRADPDRRSGDRHPRRGRVPRSHDARRRRRDRRGEPARRAVRHRAVRFRERSAVPAARGELRGRLPSVDLRRAPHHLGRNVADQPDARAERAVQRACGGPRGERAGARSRLFRLRAMDAPATALRRVRRAQALLARHVPHAAAAARPADRPGAAEPDVVPRRRAAHLAAARHRAQDRGVPEAA